MSAPHQQGDDAFGLASLTPAELAEITSVALDRAIRPAGMQVIPIPYDWGSPATAGLWRVDVSDESAQAPGQDDQAPGRLSYTYFVKLLRHPRRWPGLVHLPDQASRDEFVSFFPWRFELDMYECGIGAVLPAGMRTPRLHHVRRTDEDHLGLWWEFVPERPASWDLADYRRAAFLLGRLAARRRDGADVNRLLPQVCTQAHPAGSSLRFFTDRRILRGVRPALQAGQIWRHPLARAALRQSGDPALPGHQRRNSPRDQEPLYRLSIMHPSTGDVWGYAARSRARLPVTPAAQEPDARNLGARGVEFSGLCCWSGVLTAGGSGADAAWMAAGLR